MKGSGIGSVTPFWLAGEVSGALTGAASRIASTISVAISVKASQAVSGAVYVNDSGLDLESGTVFAKWSALAFRTGSTSVLGVGSWIVSGTGMLDMNFRRFSSVVIFGRWMCWLDNADIKINQALKREK